MNFRTSYEAYVENRKNFSQVFNTPKLNQLSAKVDEYAQKVQDAYLRIRAEDTNPIMRPPISTARRDLAINQEKMEKAAKKYNDFLAKQFYAQKAFERLNNIK